MDAITELEWMRRRMSPTERAMEWMPKVKPYTGVTPFRGVNQALNRSWGGMRLGDALPVVGEVPEGQARWETLTRPRETWEDYAVLPAEVIGLAGMGPKGPRRAPRRDIFAGAGAKTADRVALERAQQMASQGVDAGKIWEDTGWWVPTEGGPIPPGGAPRFEIPDPPSDTPVKRVTPMGEKAGADYAHRAKVLESAAWLKDFAAKNKLDIPETLSQMRELGFEMPPKEAIQQAMTLQQSPGTMMARAHTYKQMAEREAMGPGTLAERYPHPELYEAYPQLKDYRVELVGADRIGGARGEFDPGQKKIRIDRSLPNEEAASTLMHEAQHGVQEIEPDFSPGGNQSAALERMGQGMDVPSRLQLLERMRGSMQRVLKEQDLTEVERKRVLKDLRETEAKIARLKPKVPTPEAMNAWRQMDDFERYRHLGGEAEARLVQNRQRIQQQAQKRKAYPWTKVGGLDVPLEYIIP